MDVNSLSHTKWNCKYHIRKKERMRIVNVRLSFHFGKKMNKKRLVGNNFYGNAICKGIFRGKNFKNT